MSRQSELAQLGRVFDTGPLSNRNVVVNGAMQVAQRSTSQTGVNSNGYHTLDRWNMLIQGGAAYTMSQDSDAPSGFNNSLKLACTTADASPATNDRTFLQTMFEGQDLQRFGKGTSDAKKFVLSFWVKSTVTGTYQINIQDDDNTRMNSGSYTIDTASTWEYKTVIIDNETSNAFDDDANRSAIFEWILSAGPTYTSGTAPSAWEALSSGDRAASQTANIAASTSDTWQITGVQLEVGDTATPFEHRSYGDELARCQRYYQKEIATGASYYRFAPGVSISTTVGESLFNFDPVMRAAPTLDRGGSMSWQQGATGRTGNSFAAGNITPYGARFQVTVSSGLTVGYGGFAYANNDQTAYVAWDAEL